jgi:hypothetical protein
LAESEVLSGFLGCADRRDVPIQDVTREDREETHTRAVKNSMSFSAAEDHRPAQF